MHIRKRTEVRHVCGLLLHLCYTVVGLLKALVHGSLSSGHFRFDFFNGFLVSIILLRLGRGLCGLSRKFRVVLLDLDLDSLLTGNKHLLHLGGLFLRFLDGLNVLTVGVNGRVLKLLLLELSLLFSGDLAQFGLLLASAHLGPRLLLRHEGLSGGGDGGSLVDIVGRCLVQLDGRTLGGSGLSLLRFLLRRLLCLGLLLGGGLLLLLLSLCLHLSFGLGLSLFLDASPSLSGLLNLNLSLLLRGSLVLRLSLSFFAATWLLGSHGLGDLLISVALIAKGLQLLGIDLRHVNASRLVDLLLDLDLLLHFDLLRLLLLGELLLSHASLLLRLHLSLSLGFGLCLHFRNLLGREAGSRVVLGAILSLLTILSHRLIGNVCVRGEHAETTE